MYKIIIIILASIITTTAYSKENMVGFGAASCNEAIPNFNNKIYRLGLLSWTTGFYTGVNMTLITKGELPRNVSNINEKIIINQIEIYCLENPEKPIISAVERMYRNLPATKN